MTRFNDGFIEELRARIDLLEVVEKAVALRKTGANWSGLCPFHNEKTPSFTVRPDKGFYKCFGCGESGDAISFLRKLRGLSFEEAVTELAAQAGLPLPADPGQDEAWQRRQREQERLLTLVAEADRWFRHNLREPVGAEARRYLLNRGLEPPAWERYGLGYAPPGWTGLLDHLGGAVGGGAVGTALEQAGLAVRKEGREGWYDRFRDRITFPIRDTQGRCVGFGGRVLQSDAKPKYINSPETPLFQKGKLLYGLELAQEAIRREEMAIVVEGYMDRIALDHHGVVCAVATLGTALTGDHLRLLWRRARRLYFCFDGDNAGRKAAWRALEGVMDGLEADRHARFLFLPQGEDPDDVVRREGEKGFRQRLEQAVPPTEFLFDHLKEGLELTTPEGRAALAHRARPYLEKVADPLLKEFIARDFGERLGLSGDQMLQGAVRPPEGAGYGNPLPSSPHGGASPTWMSRPPRRAQPARTLPTPEHGPAGRNPERLLLALVLRHPELLVEFEEELGALDLTTPAWSQLLSELILRSYAPSGKNRPLSASLEETARAILRNEADVLAGDETAARQELNGCLVSLQQATLDRETRSLEEKARRGELNDERDMLRHWELKKERERLRSQKRTRTP